MTLLYIGIGILVIAWLLLALAARRRRNESLGGSGSPLNPGEESAKEAHRMHLIEEEVRIREDKARELQEVRREEQGRFPGDR